jgi:hypothetical protein
MMDRVYECEITKKADITKILEADPYAEDSFARAGYKMKDGAAVGEDREKLYVYVSASEEFMKKADEKLKDIAKPAGDEVAGRVIAKIQEEENSVAAGVSMFGD